MQGAGWGTGKASLVTLLFLLPHKHIFHPKVMLRYFHPLTQSSRLILATLGVSQRPLLEYHKGKDKDSFPVST